MEKTTLLRQRFDGVSLVDGFAKAQALVLRPLEQYVPEHTNHPETEQERFREACSSLQDELNQILNTKIADEQKALLQTTLMLLMDRGWNRQIVQIINQGVTAETAVHQATEQIVNRIGQIEDVYLRERLNDFKDLAMRVLHTLERLNKSGTKLQKLPNKVILVAKSLGPAELLDYDLSKIKGIVLAEGSQTMHVTIVARAYGIPLLGGIDDVCQHVKSGDLLILDCQNGRLYQNPSDDVIDEVNHLQERDRKRTQLENKNKETPSLTLDGEKIELGVNLGLADDLLLANAPNFDKVGLYRTELPFMLAKALPTCAEQVKTYQKVLAHAKGKPVIFRTLDIGSDKVLPYVHHQEEENPAMGWRSTRMTLDRRSLLRTQLRALIRAVDGRPLWVMFPMIAEVGEFLASKKTLELELKNAEKRGETLPSEVHVGSMLEIPSLIFGLKSFIHLFDFISVGTNDLMQFMFAADRSNLNASARYDTLNVSFLKALNYIQQVCRTAHVPCSVCGEMAGRPIEALALIGLGYTSLSMNPRSLLRVKTALRGIDKVEFQNYLERLLKTEHLSVRTQLQSYLRDHGVLF